jgi:small subunit ribosomal protein S6
VREYEFTVITKAELPDTEKAKVIQGYEAILFRSGGEALKREEWGSKRMSFPINKHFRGYYVHYDLTSTPADVAEAERLLRIDENILRYLVVKINDEVNVEERKVELAKAALALQQESHH